MAKPVKISRTISPIIQTKKDNPRVYDALANLDKRVAKRITDAVTKVQNDFGELATSKMTEIIFLGYYVDGGYVGVLGNELKFRSPIDNYQYKQAQVSYIWSQFSTRTANPTNADGSPFTNGQLNEPSQAAANSGAGEIFWMQCYVEKFTGAVNCNVSYRLEATATETITNDGVLAVFAVCQRALT